MMSPALVHEAYLMNLLGHLKLAHERGLKPEAVQEYFMASQFAKGADAVAYLGRDLARQVLDRDARARTGWPDAFRALREGLDQQFAPDPGDLAPAQPRATAEQVLALLEATRLANLAQEIGLDHPDALFDAEALRRIGERPEWGIHTRGRPQLEVVHEVIRAAARRLGGETDLLDWLVYRLLAKKARAELERKHGDPLQHFRGLVVGPAEGEARRAEAEAVEFGYGTLTPLLSFAALDRRLARLQERMADDGKQLLRLCEQAHPGLRRVLRLRLAVAVQLEANYREAVRLLLGTEAPADDGREEADDADGDLLAEQLLARLVEAAEEEGSPSGLGQAARAERPAEALGEWEAAGTVRCDWNDPVAGRVEEVGPLTVRPAPEPEGFARRLLQRVGMRQPRRPPLVVELAGTKEVVVTLSNLGPQREQVVKERLPGAVRATSGDTLRDRIRRASLAPPRPPAPARAMDKAPRQPKVRYDLPASTRVLFERALEILNPRPWDQPEVDLAAALDSAKPHLEEGQFLFDCPRSLEDLVKQVKGTAQH
jgi:hypothetical protein